MASRLARQWVVALCADVPEDHRRVAELLTSELVANAVRHPGPAEPGREVDIAVRVSRTGRTLRVDVHDHDPTPLPPVDRPLTPRESGMGLHLVDELASAWGSHPTPGGDGKVVWFELELPDGG